MPGRIVGAAGSASLLAMLLTVTACSSPLPTASRPPSSTGASVSPVPVLAKDAGPRRYAQGPASAAGAGRYRYTVVLRDTATGIASRFHVCVADVWAGLPAGVDNGAMPVGTEVAIALARSEVRPDGTVRCPQ